MDCSQSDGYKPLGNSSNEATTSQVLILTTQPASAQRHVHEPQLLLLMNRETLPVEMDNKCLCAFPGVHRGRARVCIAAAVYTGACRRQLARIGCLLANVLVCLSRELQPPSIRVAN